MTREPLLQRAASGDEDARARLVADFGGPLRRFVERRMGHRLRRECSSADVVQDVFARVFRAVDRLPADADRHTFRRWLFRNADWVLRTRGAAAQHFCGESEAGPAGLPPIAAASGPAMGDVTRADQMSWLAALLDRLPAHYSEVVRLRLSGRSFAEIGRQLGVEEDTVRQRFARILRVLRERSGT